jgi:hypothetical protein
MLPKAIDDFIALDLTADCEEKESSPSAPNKDFARITIVSAAGVILVHIGGTHACQD